MGFKPFQKQIFLVHWYLLIHISKGPGRTFNEGCVIQCTYTCSSWMTVCVCWMQWLFATPDTICQAISCPNRLTLLFIYAFPFGKLLLRCLLFAFGITALCDCFRSRKTLDTATWLRGCCIEGCSGLIQMSARNGVHRSSGLLACGRLGAIITRTWTRIVQQVQSTLCSSTILARHSKTVTVSWYGIIKALAAFCFLH